MKNIRRTIGDLRRDWSGRAYDIHESSCLAWCGAVAKAVTGSDPVEPIIELYKNKSEAKRVMAKNKWRDMGDVAASLYPEIAPADAKDGDWAFVTPEESHGTLGVVCGPHVTVKAERGIGLVPRGTIRRAFRVT